MMDATIARPKANYGLGGVPMVFLLLLALPPFVYYMLFCVAENGGALFLPTSGQDFARIFSRVAAPDGASVLAFGLWFGLQVLLQIYAPGKLEEGLPLSDGSRLKYKMNGWFSWWTTWAVIGVAIYAGWLSPTFFYDELFPLLTTVNVFTALFCVFLYVHGKRTDAKSPITGNVLYDYWMGTGLNPRIGSFDLKLFCEARPGLILWVAG